MSSGAAVTNIESQDRTQRIKQSVRILFYVFALYMALPIIDVPLLGLSLSAPIFFVIALEVFFRPRRAWLRRYRRWVLLAAALWLAIFLSALLNGILSGGVDLDSDGLITIVRYAYWLLVFVVTAYLVSEGGLGPGVSALLGWGAFLLALLRWGEVLLYGNLGAWTGTHLMAQNSYGFIFSTFAPFTFNLLVGSRGRVRWLAALANIVLWGAAAVNGSRGSWVAIGAAVAVQLGLLLFARLRSARLPLLVVLATVALGALVLATPNPVARAVEQRFSTFNNLEEDKSYAIRLLMNQKALALFNESPIIGVGTARFRKESTPLVLPAVLQYAHQDYFDRRSAHNSYLGFLAECGLLGAVPYGLLLLTLALKGGSAAFFLAKRGQYWAAGVYAGFVGMSIHMWVINSLTNSANWMVYGLVAALIIIGRQVAKIQQNTQISFKSQRIL